MKYALWTVQVLLAALFLFAGVAKLTMPIEEMTAVVPLPGLFIQFIGVCEVLGAIGLILPGLTRIQPILTPMAAAGLVIIMVGATVITAATMDIPSASFPFVTLLLVSFVAYGRFSLAPQTPRTTQRLVLQLAR
ncbi:MAG TPA: DoxX family protein [Chloroflexota bacterium]|nr:DoxX family protein [Chloroflexota bacterium]